MNAARFALSLTLAVLVAWLSACGSCPKCPVTPAPPPVTIIAPRPHCTLPILPSPIESLGMPDAQRDGYFVPRQSWALLGGYIEGVREYILAMSECLARDGAVP